MKQEIDIGKIQNVDTRPGISRESLPLADFLDGWMDGSTDRRTNGWSNGRMGVREDWYPLWEAQDDYLRGFTGMDERKKNSLPTDGWTDRRTDGRTDGPMDGPTDGQELLQSGLFATKN